MGRSVANKYIFKDGLSKVAILRISLSKKNHLGENFPVKFKNCKINNYLMSTLPLSTSTQGFDVYGV